MGELANNKVALTTAANVYLVVHLNRHLQVAIYLQTTNKGMQCAPTSRSPKRTNRMEVRAAISNVALEMFPRPKSANNNNN
jgi:hypothetical protein